MSSSGSPVIRCFNTLICVMRLAAKMYASLFSHTHTQGCFSTYTYSEAWDRQETGSGIWSQIRSWLSTFMVPVVFRSSAPNVTETQWGKAERWLATSGIPLGALCLFVDSYFPACLKMWQQLFTMGVLILQLQAVKYSQAGQRVKANRWA